MDKGQHLRILLKTVKPGPSDTIIEKNAVIALATDFTFHASASTENSTTKDSTDLSGLWDEFEIMGKSYDIQVSALIGVGSDTGQNLDDILDSITDSPLDWEMAIFGGNNNRIKATSIASGKCKITNVNPVGQNRQNATYSATLNGYGPITVAS